MADRTPTTRTVWIASAAIVAVGIALVIGLSVWSRGGSTPTAAGAASPSSTIGSTPASPSASGATGTTTTTGPAASGATPSPAPTKATELEPGMQQTLGTQPPPSPLPTGPSLAGPLPATASARGETLVAGFPSQVVPVLPDLRLVSSSVSGEGSRLQIGFEAGSDDSPTTVTSRYVTTLTGTGFVAAPSPAVAGSTATRFTRGPDGVVLTVTDRVGGGTELVVAGTLTTAG